MKAHLIWNPSAGQHDVRQPLEEAVEVLENGGWSVSVFESTRPEHGTHLARAAVADGADVAIAAGGDGTVNRVVNGLVGSRVALGVLPVGTGNVWAKQLGLPGWVFGHRHPLGEAAQGLLASSSRHVDLGRANGRYFLLWSGIGFDAQVAQEVEPLVEMRRRLGNTLYFVSALSLALSFVGTRSTLVIDDEVIHRRVVLVVISNARLYGGGFFHLAPAACLDDGHLDVLVFRGHGTMATVQHFVNVLRSYHMRDPRMSYYRARRVAIYGDQPMAVQVDGDPAGKTPLAVEVAERALKILVPPSAPASLFNRSAPAALS